MENIGERIKRIRKSRGVTLKTLSETSGLSISYISDIENGRKNPSLESLRKIVEPLGQHLTDFFRGINPNARLGLYPDQFSAPFETELREVLINTIKVTRMTKEEFTRRLIALVNDLYGDKIISLEGGNIIIPDNGLGNESITIGDLFALLQEMLNEGDV